MSLLAILTASLIGSLHCAAMCGGIATFAAAQSPRPWTAVIAYNGGRLLTYLVLGLLAGVFGQAVDMAGSGVGVARLSAILLGVLMVTWGVLQLTRTSWSWAAPFHQAVFRLHQSVLGRVRGMNAVLGPLTVGLLSTLMPCGWLYTFAAVAAATGQILDALVVMLVFWVGTLPMMTFLGRVARGLLTRWSVELPAVTASLVIVAGVMSIFGHVAISHDHHSGDSHHPHHHADR